MSKREIDPMDMMYRDDSIPLSDDLPQHLLDTLNQLDSYYDNNDWQSFILNLEGAEVLIKAYEINGTISRSELNRLFRRYGLC